MHDSSRFFGDLFFKTYVNEGSTVVEVGSQYVNGSLRDYVPSHCMYIGIDMVEGDGVDIKLKDPYRYPVPDNSVDFVVSSSVFEHVDFFWVAFVEMLRILKPSGVLYINAPSNGSYHRYPNDSWRFYPDSAMSLCRWGRQAGISNLHLLESFVGKPMEQMWKDNVMVFLKDASYVSCYPNRMITEQSFYENLHLDSSDEVINFQEWV
jgi:SAM-dependent methyltransferase